MSNGRKIPLSKLQGEALFKAQSETTRLPGDPVLTRSQIERVLDCADRAFIRHGSVPMYRGRKTLIDDIAEALKPCGAQMKDGEHVIYECDKHANHEKDGTNPSHGASSDYYEWEGDDR